MPSIERPLIHPARPQFSSGPCVKRPGWSVEVLQNALLGHSHRGPLGVARIQEMLGRCRNLLGLPTDYQIALVPGSDTGAVEMALWSLLGPKPVDILAFDVFGYRWSHSIIHELKLPDVNLLESFDGHCSDLSKINSDHDLVFTWNGTTSGVRVPEGAWIDPQRKGLTICDATSAVFAEDLPWSLLDVTTFSWQKTLGGEGGHGIVILSPRAVERLDSYTPSWPIPKNMRLKEGGKFNAGLFQGLTLNTPSMLCVEDVLDALKWAESIGGLPAMIARSQQNLRAIEEWANTRDWVSFFADPSIRSSTSICLRIGHGEQQKTLPRAISTLLEAEGVAFDINNHSAASPGLRIWGGPTVEVEDIKALLPWIEWGYYQTLNPSLS